MYKIMMKQPLLVTLLMILGSGGAVSAEDGFYTIIGPDGRPMIIPQKKQSQPKTLPAQQKPEQNLHNEEVKKVEEKQKQPDKIISSVRKVPETQIATETSSQKYHPRIPVSSHTVPAVSAPAEQVKPEETQKQSAQSPAVKTGLPKVTSAPASAPVQTPLPAVMPASTAEKPDKREQPKPKPPVEQVKHETTGSTPLTQVDGVEYVNNEYLEAQEFNLDGKKRFYSMPDGTGRMETIERKKGVSQSMLNRLLNRNIKAEVPVVLSSTYIRLSAEDLATTFENDRCFLKDYTKSIKTLTPKKEVGVWPRKPLKEKFEYDVVKLELGIEYIQIASYAASNEKPVYYWPLVVFLDKKGCAQEAVSGFKNNSVNTTLLQHAAIQGVIKIPPQAEYLMMTPLASAIDVPESELSNQGQIRISALK